MRWMMWLTATALCAGSTACGEERRPAASSGGAIEVPITPAHKSPDPPPAIPLMVERETPAAGSAEPGEGGVSGGAVPISDADRVVAGLRPKFRACYQSGLNDDPAMQGRVILSARVAPDGTVESVDPASGEGLSARVTSCLADTVKRAQFSAPAARVRPCRSP